MVAVSIVANSHRDDMRGIGRRGGTGANNNYVKLASAHPTPQRLREVWLSFYLGTGG